MKKKEESKKESKKKEDNLGVIYLGERGIVRVSYGGKVFLLFLTGILSLWVLVLILVNWDRVTSHGNIGKAVAYLSAISLGLLSIPVFQKFFSSRMYINFNRQLAVFIYFITVFLFIYYFNDDDFTGEVYENPLKMTYIFIFFYLVSFYILHNFSSRQIIF